MLNGDLISALRLVDKNRHNFKLVKICEIEKKKKTGLGKIIAGLVCVREQSTDREFIFNRKTVCDFE